MMLPAPRETGPRNHLAYYVDLGINCIPLAVGQKEPYVSIIGKQWKPWQTQRISQAQAEAWHTLAQGAHYGVGLICGAISGGLVCLDFDDRPFSAWILDHRDHPLLYGLWIVETGSGKAHVWLRTTSVPRTHQWNIRAGLKAGEVRGEGSYAAAPPSIHPNTGRQYESRTGEPEHIGYIQDADVLARLLTDAYLTDNPISLPPAQETVHSQAFHEPDKEQRAEIYSRVRAARFKGKIQNTLLKPGWYTPGKGYWQNLESYSHIDFAIACAMVRKGWTQDEAEWVFAGSEAAVGCYANRQRKGSRGHSYWAYTWTNAAAQVAQEERAKLVATGADFRVIEVTAYGSYEPRYKILMETVGRTGGEKRYEVIVTAEELSSEVRFKLACLKQTIVWQPRFTSGQRGHDFEQFTNSVTAMLSDTEIIPAQFSTTGALEQRILSFLEMCSPFVPRERGEISVGWQEGELFYVRGDSLLQAVRSFDHRLKPEQFGDVMRNMAYVEEVIYAMEVGKPIRVLKLQLKRGASRALSPPDAALGGS